MTLVAPTARRPPRTMPALPALRAGVRVPPGAVVLRRERTLAEHVEPFLLWMAGVRDRAPATIQAYRRDLTCFARFCQEAGIETPDGVTHQVIEFYVAWLRERGERQASTAARRLSCLRGFFRYLTRDGVVARDPAAVAFGPRFSRWRLPAYLTVSEQERLLAQLAADPSLAGRRDHAIIATLLLTGLRAAEACALQQAHVDLESGVCHVFGGKGGKDREVPIPPSLGRCLATYTQAVRPQLLGAAASPYVFCHLPADGACRGHMHGRQPWTARAGVAPLSRQQLFRAVVTRVSPIVGRRVHPHMLRHSYASRLRAAGADLQLIQECLGHESIQTTTIYAHLSTPARLTEVARLLEGPAAPGSSFGSAASVPTLTREPTGPTEVPPGRQRRRDAHVGPHRVLGDRIRALRHQLGLRQPDLAAKLGVGLMTVVRAERGAFVPRLATLQQLAALGGVAVGDLLEPETG